MHLTDATPRRPAPLAWAVALTFGLAAVVGVAAIDSSPGDALLTRELVRSPLAVVAVPMEGPEADLLLTTEVVRSGESVYSLLSRSGVFDAEALQVIRSNAALTALRQLVPGARVTLGRDGDGLLHKLDYLAPDLRRVSVVRTDDGLQVDTSRAQPEVRIAVRAGEVGRSLFASLTALDVPDAVQRQLVGVFSKQFDLHRAAREIERFAVAYEELTVDGAVVRQGRVLATELVRDGRTYRAVWFATGQGGKYFTPEGFTLDRTFLPSPVEFTQVTSWFGQMRDLRWNPGVAHRGIDYAAPIGTPVHAAGEGVVEFVGEQRGYGNVILLRHREPYTTLYAHLDSFAEGLEKGQRIRQGEPIGTVGRTGWATGPHLHYEFRVNGEAQNPVGETIAAEELASPLALTRFREQSAPLAELLDRITRVELTRVAGTVSRP